MPPKTFDYLTMLSVLSAHKVDFVVIGGICAMIHGSSMGTVDVDIVPERSHQNYQRLEAALTELNAYYREHSPGHIRPSAERMNTAGHHLLMTDVGALDVLGSVTGGREYLELIESGIEVKLNESTSITILSLPMLIQLKKETNRVKDRMALPILQQLLRKAQRVEVAETEEK